MAATVPAGIDDPAQVPVRMAATVLILDQRPDVHVLMLKRNARSVFVGDMWVFPGGAVDPGDATDAADRVVEHLSDAVASHRLGLPASGLAFWVAALRETFEEAGVLLARRSGSDTLVDLSDPVVASRFAAHRGDVNAGAADFIDIVAAEDLLLDGADVHYVARWVTPLGPPRRYDTRFFVTAMPAGQVPLHDNDEAVHHEWVRPGDAITANERGEMVMMTPTIAMLTRLASFESVADALRAAARAGSGHDEAVRIRPGVAGPARIAVPGDPDYGSADSRAEFGIIRWPID